MDYVRQVLDSEKLYNIFDLPHSLRGRMVEIIVLPVQDERASNARLGSAYGCLHKYAEPSLISKEKGAWEQAVMKKYADR